MPDVELTERNRKTVMDFYSGVATGSPENPARLFHEDVVVYEPHILPWGGVYRGMAGQRKLGAAQQALDPTSLTILALYADGEHVVSVLTVNVKESATPLMLSEHMRLSDGLIIEQRVFVFGDDKRPLNEVLSH